MIMKKIKLNQFSIDNLLPSTSAPFNNPKYIEWTTDGSGEANFYFSQMSREALNDRSGKPKFIWLLESKQIIPFHYKWLVNNYEIISEEVDGIFSCDQKLCHDYPKITYVISNAVPWVQDRKIYKKKKLVSMISSNKKMCEGHKKRLDFVKKFQGKVDLYGRGHKEIHNKEEGLKDYMFSIAIQNAVYDTYFTELLTDCFATGTIPIYYGSRGVTEYFNEDGIIFLNDSFDLSILTSDLYYSKMEAIKDNFERAIEFPCAEDWLYENFFK